MNKNIILSILFGLVFLAVVLGLLILGAKSDIKAQNQDNIDFEKKALYINSLKSRYTQENLKAMDDLSKEHGVQGKVLGSKTSFTAKNIRFKEFDRIANKVLNSSIIIEEFVVIKKSQDKIDFTIVGKK